MATVSISVLVNLEKLLVAAAAYSARARLYGIANSRWRGIGLAEICLGIASLYVFNNGRSRLLLSIIIDGESWFSANLLIDTQMGLAGS